MPFREASKHLADISRTAGSAYDRQLNRLQHTQSATATLALQRKMREIDQRFQNSINEQFSKAVQGVPIHEDWLDEDFRQTQLREMFDEAMQDVRGYVSTPGGQVELESRAETMWQQYEFDWREKSTQAMRAWNAQADLKNIDDMIDMSTLETADQSLARIQQMNRDSVAAGTISPQEGIQRNDAAQEQLFNTVLMREIQNPTDEEGEPFGPYELDEAYRSSVAKIEAEAEKRNISRTHADELIGAAEAHREGQRQVIADNLTAGGVRQLQDAAADMVSRGEFRDLDYGEWMDSFNKLMDYNVINREQQDEFRLRVNQEINRLNDALSARRGDDTADQAAQLYEALFLGAIQRGDLETADAISDARSEDSLFNHFMHEFGDDPTFRLRMEKTQDRLRPRLTEVHEDPFYNNPSAEREFDQILHSLGIHPDSPLARDWATEIIQDLAPGADRRITSEMVKEWARGAFDRTVLEDLRERRFFADATTRLGQPGISWGIVGQGLHDISVSQIGPTPIGRAVEAIVRELPQEALRDGSGKFDAQMLKDITERLILPHGVELEEQPKAVQEFHRTMHTTAAIMLEAIDLGGAVIMDKKTMDDYEIVNIEWDNARGTPIFTIAGMASQQGGLYRDTRQEYIFTFDTTQENNPVMEQLIREPYTGDMRRVDSHSLKQMRDIIGGRNPNPQDIKIPEGPRAF